MDLRHDFIKPPTSFIYRYRKCMYCNKIKTFKAVYKCKDCIEVCHRECHTKFIEMELNHNEEYVRTVSLHCIYLIYTVPIFVLCNTNKIDGIPSYKKINFADQTFNRFF